MHSYKLSCAFFLGCLFPLFLGGCSFEADSNTDTGKRKRAQSEHLVRTVLSVRKPVVLESVQTGSVLARKIVRVHTQEEGRLTQLPFFEGDFVKEGEELFRLDSSLLRAELAKARATREQAQLDLRRLENLLKRRSVSEDDVSKARTTLAVAKANEGILRTRISYTFFAAPFAGQVTQRLSEPGDFVPKHTHILTLADPDSLVVEITVSELLLPFLSVGYVVSIRVDALGTESLAGYVSRIHANVDAASRRGRVEVAFDQLPNGLRAGQFARVNVGVKTSPYVMVPFAALRRDRDREFVFVYSGGKARLQMVRSGLRMGDEIAILEGLEQGATVVTKGFIGLQDGKTIVIANQQTDKPNAKNEKEQTSNNHAITSG